MNLNHLGDALDFWKGALIAGLSDQLRGLHVLPMLTDVMGPVVWSSGQLQLYARLLGVAVDRILRGGDPFPGPNRTAYFRDLPVADDDDLFVDPDTGIEPTSGGDGRHIRLSELSVLLPVDATRVVLTYQHSFRANNWVRVCLQRVARSPHLKGCHSFA